MFCSSSLVFHGSMIFIFVGLVWVRHFGWRDSIDWTM